MKKINLHRIISGIGRIKKNKMLLAFPIVWLLVDAILIYTGWHFLLTLDKPFSSDLFARLFLIFMVEVAFIGLMLIFMALGTPMSSKKTEQGLMEINFVDNTGEAPALISKVKDKNGFVLEFYSPRIPFYEYEKQREKIETVMNIKIVSIDPGKDKQHVKVKVISSGGSTPDIIRWNDNLLNKDDFILKLGESYFGDESFDLSVTPHVLIGGGSGSGKSKLLKLLLMECMKKGADVYLADFKGGVDYPKVWHEKCSIIFEAEKLLDQLSVILEIMEDRRRQLVNSGASNIHEHNHNTKSNMQRIIVACDEVAEVLDKTGLDKDEKAMVTQIEGKVSTIARQGRAFGIHLILATQRPDADVLKGQIKNNIGMRICGRADKVLSQIILDNTNGADKISQKDQGMFLTNTNVLFKAYYVEDDCLEGVV